jgi:hypothetical protein
MVRTMFPAHVSRNRQMSRPSIFLFAVTEMIQSASQTRQQHSPQPSNLNILICWEHDALTDIVEALGVKKKNAPTYPGDK